MRRVCLAWSAACTAVPVLVPPDVAAVPLAGGHTGPLLAGPDYALAKHQLDELQTSQDATDKETSATVNADEAEIDHENQDETALEVTRDLQEDLGGEEASGAVVAAEEDQDTVRCNTQMYVVRHQFEVCRQKLAADDFQFRDQRLLAWRKLGVAKAQINKLLPEVLKKRAILRPLLVEQKRLQHELANKEQEIRWEKGQWSPERDLPQNLTPFDGQYDSFAQEHVTIRKVDPSLDDDDSDAHFDRLVSQAVGEDVGSAQTDPTAQSAADASEGTEASIDAVIGDVGHGAADDVDFDSAMKGADAEDVEEEDDRPKQPLPDKVVWPEPPSKNGTAKVVNPFDSSTVKPPPEPTPEPAMSWALRNLAENKLGTYPDGLKAYGYGDTGYKFTPSTLPPPSPSQQCTKDLAYVRALNQSCANATVVNGKKRDAAKAQFANTTKAAESKAKALLKELMDLDNLTASAQTGNAALRRAHAKADRTMKFLFDNPFAERSLIATDAKSKKKKKRRFAAAQEGQHVLRGALRRWPPMEAD
mmetsp:Transcript_28310/g.67981  ORF Transcript_28310/g.67981 Transcript_28310/m.67981 type:complete len:532 (-) Transcript_28310:50-1645(-)